MLVNPTAGRLAGKRGAARLEGVRRKLKVERLEAELVRTESPAHAASEARAAAEAGEEVVAFGGDGMVRITGAAMRGSDAILGILPGGRGNDLAAVLGIPRDPIMACDVLASGRAIPVDAGQVNGELFLGIASIGLESEVTPIANAAPRWGGRAVYLGATLYGLARWRPARFELELDGERHAHTGYLAAAANSGRFGAGMRLAPAARLDDGLLDVVLIEHVSRLHFVRATPKVFKGTHVEEPNVRMWRAARVRLEADRPFAVYADGDQVAHTPALIEAIPGALQIRAPR